MRAIVTGASGFLGQHLVHELRHQGVTVVSICRRAGSVLSAVSIGEAPWNPTRLARIFEEVEPDLIFHLAGGMHGEPMDLRRVNVGLASSITRAVLDAGIRPALVFCGSAAEYGASIVDGVPISEKMICVPVSPYGTTKLEQTRLALAFSDRTGIRVIVARPFNPIGPGMPTHLALGEFAFQLATGGRAVVLETGNLDVERDFMGAGQVCSALFQLAANPEANGLVNICSGRAIQLRILVEMLGNVSGKQITLRRVRARIRAGEPKVIVGNISRLEQLGAVQAPTDFPAVIQRIWADAQMRWDAPAYASSR